MLTHIWGILSTVLPTATALFAWLEAKASNKKNDIIIVQTNGNLARLYKRNEQLASELSKYNVPIPPPEEKP